VIGLVGYYGWSNYGDDIFLETWREKLGFHRAVSITPYDNLDGFDKIIIGGGDLIWDVVFNNNYFNEKWYENGKKVYIYGIGVADPSIKKFKNENTFKLYKNFFSKASYVSARDILSCNWIRDVLDIKNVELVEDIAWNYESKISEPKEKGSVGITYRRNELYSFREMSSLIINLIDRSKDSDKSKNIKFIPLQTGFYNTISLHNSLKEEIVRSVSYANINSMPIQYDTQHKYSYIRSCDYYITCAFHGLVTALKERVPVLCLLHSNKAKQLAAKIKMPEIIVNKNNLYNMVTHLFSPDYTYNNDILNKLENDAKVQMNSFIQKYINN